MLERVHLSIQNDLLSPLQSIDYLLENMLNTSISSSSNSNLDLLSYSSIKILRNSSKIVLFKIKNLVDLRLIHLKTMEMSMSGFQANFVVKQLLLVMSDQIKIKNLDIKIEGGDFTFNCDRNRV